VLSSSHQGRRIKVSTGRARLTKSGFFDREHLGDLARSALEITNDAEGVYFTLNPLHFDLLARRCNRVDVALEGENAQDVDVTHRRWLLVDADSKRRAGISSTEAEKAAALDVVRRVLGYLQSLGWPEPILADSGNGYDLLYRIDLPADDGGLVRRVLTALGYRFSTAEVDIDQKVFNPARIVKFYGTLSRKGDSTADRPHRWSQILELPPEIEVVPTELLEALAVEARNEPRTTAGVVRQRTMAGYRIGLEQVRERARAYLSKVPPAVAGENGSGTTFKAACTLVLGFDLSPDDALPLLQEWNATCQPQWSEKELLLRSCKGRASHRPLLTQWSARQGPPSRLHPLSPSPGHPAARRCWGRS
jgi:hypothetical protein